MRETSIQIGLLDLARTKVLRAGASYYSYSISPSSYGIQGSRPDAVSHYITATYLSKVGR